MLIRSRSLHIAADETLWSLAVNCTLLRRRGTNQSDEYPQLPSPL